MIFQTTISTGMVVKMLRKMVVLVPPPSLEEKYHGVPMRAAARAMLENCS
jgi:hypothetical protein